MRTALGNPAGHIPHELKYKKWIKQLHQAKVTNFINRMSIHQRPKEADGNRFGDWEMDTIVDPCGRAILTLKDPANYLLMERLPRGRKAQPVADTLVRLLVPYRNKVKTITTDNGCEVIAHLAITNKLSVRGRDKIIVYFADSYSSWQKGAIENVNKLIRKYIRKKENFEHLTDRKIKNIQKKLNTRPSQKLNFDTPKCRFFNNFT